MTAQKPVGTITGFSLIQTEQSNDGGSGTRTIGVEELLDRVRALRVNLDPERIQNIESLITQHMTDHGNPHQVTSTQMDVDFVQELYDVWVGLGNTGDINTFISILFRDNRIATEEEVLNGTGTGIVTAENALSLIRYHLGESEGHSAVINRFVTGTPVTKHPSVSIIAALADMMGVVCTRTSPITVVGMNGLLTTYPSNTVAIDYSYGTPMLPLWGARTNLIANSDPVENTQISTIGATTLVDTAIIAPDGSSPYLITSDTSNGAHGIIIPINNENGRIYTDSIFVYPRIQLGYIRLAITNRDALPVWLNIETGEITSSSQEVMGYATRLSSGWYRIAIEYEALGTTATSIRVTHVSDTMETGYIGTNEPLFNIACTQHAEGRGMSPYIPTNGTIETCTATTLDMSFNSSLVNTHTGMVSLTYLITNHPEIAPKTIIDIDGQMMVSIVENTFNLDMVGTTTVVDIPIHKKVTTAYSYKSDMISICSNGFPRNDTAGVYTPLISAPMSITLGAFDGYLEEVSIYQYAETTKELEFLIGENLV